jgi:alpha-galactosidase
MNRRDVLAGTDYAVCCVEVSGTACVAWDNDIPLKYGIDQCIGDTVGPGDHRLAAQEDPVGLPRRPDLVTLTGTRGGAI